MSFTKKIRFSIIATVGLIILAFLFYMFFIVKVGPLNSSKENSVEITGQVYDLYEDGVKDLVFKLKDDDNIYYINRALENGFNLEATKKELLGKEITLWYAKHRSGPGGHMMQLKHQDSIYYTEWEIPLASKN